MDFAIAFDLVVTNTFYIKEDEHLITFKSGSNKSQIDYFLVRSIDRIRLSKRECSKHNIDFYF